MDPSIEERIDHPKQPSDFALAAAAWTVGQRSCINYTDDKQMVDLIDMQTAQAHALTALALHKTGVRLP